MSRENAPLEFEVEIIGEEGYCSIHERAIKKWLFNSPGFKRLYIDHEDDKEAELIDGAIKRQYLECVFCNPQKIEYAEGTVGWRCTCMCSSTMAIQEEVNKIITNFDSDIRIYVDTDIQDYVYPKMKISFDISDTPTIAIANKTDNNREMQVRDAKSSPIYVDCEMGTITNDSGISYYSKIVDQRFLRLLPGENVLSVTGKFSRIEFTWNNARWMT